MGWPRRPCLPSLRAERPSWPVTTEDSRGSLFKHRNTGRLRQCLWTHSNRQSRSQVSSTLLITWGILNPQCRTGGKASPSQLIISDCGKETILSIRGQSVVRETIQLIEQTVKLHVSFKNVFIGQDSIKLNIKRILWFRYSIKFQNTQYYVKTKGVC